MSDGLTIRELKEVAEELSRALQEAVKERDMRRKQVEVFVRLAMNRPCCECPCVISCGNKAGPQCRATLLAWSLEQAKGGGG